MFARRRRGTGGRQAQYFPVFSARVSCLPSLDDMSWYHG